MLIIPESTEAFRVASFDPGSSNLGRAILESMLDKTPFTVRYADTVKLKENLRPYAEIGEMHGGRAVRLMQLYDNTLDFLREHRPHAIIVESNYLGKFATSFAALVECVITIRNAAYAYDPFMPIYMVDPTTAKQAVGMVKVKGTDKEDVRRHVKALTNIIWCVNVDDLDEHAVDAVAIGYYYLTRLL